MSNPEHLRILLAREPSDVCRVLVQGQVYACVASGEGAEPSVASVEALEQAGFSPDDALDLALQNLREASSAADVRAVDTLPGLYFVKATDGLAASRLAVLPELMAPLPYGGLVAAVPDPGQLLCVPMDSARAIDALQALASAVGHLEATRDHLLSDQLFWYDGTGWKPIPVHHGEEDITVLPPPEFLKMMSHVASMDLVSVAGEA